MSTPSRSGTTATPSGGNERGLSLEAPARRSGMEVLQGGGSVLGELLPDDASRDVDAIFHVFPQSCTFIPTDCKQPSVCEPMARDRYRPPPGPRVLPAHRRARESRPAGIALSRASLRRTAEGRVGRRAGPLRSPAQGPAGPPPCRPGRPPAHPHSSRNALSDWSYSNHRYGMGVLR